MKYTYGGVLLAVSSISAIAQTPPAPPTVATKPYAVKGPLERNDPYYWLRDDSRKNADMLAYLAAENAYTDAFMAPLKPVENRVYEEIISHIKQDDSSVPVFDRGYYYYSRFEKGADYGIIARKKGKLSAPEEIIFNQPVMAKGHDFFQIAGYQVSPNNRLVAYAVDTVGRRQNVLRVKNLTTGKTLEDSISNVEGDVAWADDNRTLYYVEKDPVTLLSKRIKAHVLGTPASSDTLVYEEKDESFYLGVQKTMDDTYICIGEQSTVSNEYRCTPSANPGVFTVIAPREREFRYDADHVGDHWVIRTNRNAKNYKLVTLADADVSRGEAGWRDLVPGRSDVFIENFTPFDHFVAIEERTGGNKHIRIQTTDGASRDIASDEPAFTMALGDNRDPAATTVRYGYASLTTPASVYSLDVNSGQRTLLKRTPTPGYDPANYVTERVWATARDGTRIPVSLVYRKGFRRDGTAALFQYAYGSYGISSDPSWSATIVPLLDRGMVYAIAHIRGGQEMGRDWYDQGHLLNKKNSFNDFIDVTRFLVANKYAAPGRVAAYGGSAGGLLMGGVANMAPQDYRVIIAQVPFVDVVTTMLDASIPLTTNEYDEWGNPAERKYYDYMLSYSPYDNVAPQAYPSMFVGTGLWDSQVQYYEPTKWVARLRATKTDSNPLLFRINMEAGHGGKSGRFERYHSIAESYAFMLDQLGVTPETGTPRPAPTQAKGERG